MVGREGLGPGPLDNLTITGAMFGDVGISGQIDRSTGAATDVPPVQVFGSGGRLQPALNTRISAVLHPVYFNPTQRAVQDKQHAAVGDMYGVVAQGVRLPTLPR